jgi:hypothetical protein
VGAYPVRGLVRRSCQAVAEDAYPVRRSCQVAAETAYALSAGLSAEVASLQAAMQLRAHTLADKVSRLRAHTLSIKVARLRPRAHTLPIKVVRLRAHALFIKVARLPQRLRPHALSVGCLSTEVARLRG